jgi:environmental stress-induced protein Ves
MQRNAVEATAPGVRLITPGEWRTQPWANGAGVTHEIARWGDGDGFDARLSMAELVARSPFSRFAGYDRWLAPAGDVTLVLPDGPRRLTRGEALTFAGELDVVGEPSAKTWDLNLMVRRGVAWSAGLVAERTERVAAAGVTALFAMGEGVGVQVAGRRVELPSRSTLLASASAGFAVAVDASAGALVAWVHFDLRG